LIETVVFTKYYLNTKIITALQRFKTNFSQSSSNSNKRTLAISSAAFSRLSSSRRTCAACSSELSICEHKASTC